MPILKNVLGNLFSSGLDDRVDLLKKASTPNAPLEFDRAELNKLPPFNDFLRKKAVDSMEAIQVSIFPDPIYSCKCKTRFKPLAPELLMKDLIDQAQKRKAQLIEVILLNSAERPKRQKGSRHRADQETSSRARRRETRTDPCRRIRCKPEASEHGEHQDPADLRPARRACSARVPALRTPALSRCSSSTRLTSSSTTTSTTSR
jgi:hypothetical protein